MIKDGFGQGYLFDNHWSATVMDGEEDLHPSPLPPHNHGSLLWAPPPSFSLAQLKVSPRFKREISNWIKIARSPKTEACAP